MNQKALGRRTSTPLHKLRRHLATGTLALALLAPVGCVSDYDLRYAPDESGYQEESDLTLGPGCAWGGPVIEGIIGGAAAIAYILGPFFCHH
jgi:hypothetical protein